MSAVLIKIAFFVVAVGGFLLGQRLIEGYRWDILGVFIMVLSVVAFIGAFAWGSGSSGSYDDCGSWSNRGSISDC